MAHKEEKKAATIAVAAHKYFEMLIQISF